MEQIAGEANLSKKTLYNIYSDKETLFRCLVDDVLSHAGGFASRLPEEFDELAAAKSPDALYELGRRLAGAILRPDVIALRRLLVGEASEFPDLAEDYFDRAPGRVMRALADGFERLADAGMLTISNPVRAAEQFAYLVAGAPLDRAIFLGLLPAEKHVADCAREGVATFLARYASRRTESESHER